MNSVFHLKDAVTLIFHKKFPVPDINQCKDCSEIIQCNVVIIHIIFLSNNYCGKTINKRNPKSRKQTVLDQLTS